MFYLSCRNDLHTIKTWEKPTNSWRFECWILLGKVQIRQKLNSQDNRDQCFYFKLRDRIIMTGSRYTLLNRVVVMMTGSRYALLNRVIVMMTGSTYALLNRVVVMMIGSTYALLNRVVVMMIGSTYALLNGS